MKRKFFFPMMAFVFAVVGAFATQSISKEANLANVEFKNGTSCETVQSCSTVVTAIPCNYTTYQNGSSCRTLQPSWVIM